MKNSIKRLRRLSRKQRAKFCAMVSAGVRIPDAGAHFGLPHTTAYRLAGQLGLTRSSLNVLARRVSRIVGKHLCELYPEIVSNSLVEVLFKNKPFDVRADFAFVLCRKLREKHGRLTEIPETENKWLH